MRNYRMVLIFVVLFVACNDTRENKTNGSAESNPALSSEGFKEGSGEDITIQPLENRSNGLISESDSASSEVVHEAKDPDLAGHYKKVAEGDEELSQDCNCHCFDLSFSANFDLCLAPEKIYITAKSRKTGAGTAAIFFVAPVKVQNLEREIPWDKFDSNTPIATVKQLPDGSLQLDWLGFSIAGELAVDYAIFGKKTLEGTFKKE